MFRKAYLLLIVLIVVLCVSYSTYAGWFSNGKAKADKTVSQTFQNGEFNFNDYNYYRCKEDTILALKKEYELVSRFWKKIENPTKEGLAEIVRKIDSRAPNDLDAIQREHGFGSNIHDQNNNLVAMGYSLGKWVIIKVVEKNKIKVAIPEVSDDGGGGGGGGGCFAADTLVLMADGSNKPISKVKPNDLVMGYDFESDKPVSVPVEKIYDVEAEQYFNVNGSDGLKVTGKHPFGIGENVFKEIEQLESGDSVIGDTDNDLSTLDYMTIKSIQRVDERKQVYDMTVGGTHNFFVVDQSKKNSFIVHNKGGGGGF